jgi:hypothetical protein
MLKMEASQQMTRATCEKHCLFGHRMLSRIRCGAISRRSSTTTTSGSTAAAIRTA